MEYGKGYIDGLNLAIVALNTVHYDPSKYEEVKAILEKSIANMEKLQDMRLDEMEEQSNV